MTQKDETLKGSLKTVHFCVLKETNARNSERPYPAFAVPVPYRTFAGKYGRTRTRTFIPQ